ncbi:MAG TPA: 50S ribosomal protein L30 [Candidatus Dormibacteraeota bacterium]|nr:50S ribosomal protein L30 [Candidatus Dormibacteraeota bacterium]
MTATPTSSRGAAAPTGDGDRLPATIRATWKKSAIGYSWKVKATIRSLGFRRLNQVRELPDTPAVRGMLASVGFLVAVDGQPWRPPRRARYKTPRARSAKKHSRGR